MNTHRLTISIPEYLYMRLKEIVPKGQMSQFAQEALNHKVMQEVTNKDVDPLENFFTLGDKLPKKEETVEELKEITRKGLM